MAFLYTMFMNDNRKKEILVFEPGVKRLVRDLVAELTSLVPMDIGC